MRNFGDKSSNHEEELKAKWTIGDSKSFSFIMILFNIALALIVVTVLVVYFLNRSYLQENASIEICKAYGEQWKDYMKDYLSKQMSTMSDIGNFIGEERMTESQAITFLEHMKNLDGTMIVLDMSSVKGQEIKVDEEKNWVRLIAVDLSGYEEIAKICEEHKNDRENQKECHSIEPMLIEGKYGLVCYQVLNMHGRMHLLLEIFEIDDIIEYALKDSSLELDIGYIITDTGDVIYAKNSVCVETDTSISVGDNLFNTLDEHNEKELCERIKTSLKEMDIGVFLREVDVEHQWIYSHTKLDYLNENWTYITRIAKHKIMNGEESSLLISILILIALPWGVNALVICYINNGLNKSVSVIERVNAELEEANRAQTTFISNMSHEIRTPINAVLGMDEMIIRETSEEEVRGYALDIKNAGRTLLGIINNILDFTKIESGKMAIIPQEYELNSMLNDLYNMTNIRMKGKSFIFKIENNPDTPSILYGDELRIKQVIINLLTNAVKYTEKGSVVFKIDYEKKSEELIDLCISVKDTGIGMKEEEIEKLFKPFERLDERRNRTIEGTGLGMNIVVGLLHEMGSDLKVESKYDYGSTFSFKLEQKVLDWCGAGSFEERCQKINQVDEDSGVVFFSTKAKILVVDDTPINSIVVIGLLKRTGVQVDTAISGMECLELVKKKKYDVILLDHRMPQMDGIETLKRLKQMESLNHETPVVALTANAVSGAYEYYMKEGFDDFMSKPINGPALERLILKYLPEDILEDEVDQASKINEKEGIKNCGNKEIYLKAVEEFVATAQKAAKLIKEYYDKEEIENYTIKVHALKSTARLVGATNLSKEAAYLENCGNENKIDEIQKKTLPLLMYYEKTVANLIEMFDLSKQDENKDIIDIKELKEALIAVLEFNKAFDFDNVDSVMEQIRNYKVPDKFDAEMKQLNEAIYDVNQEEIENVINSILGGMENG